MLEGAAQRAEKADWRAAIVAVHVAAAGGVEITVEQVLGRPLRYLKAAAPAEPAAPRYPGTEAARLLGI